MGEIRLIFLFQLYIISIWVNFPFVTLLGAQFRLEFFTLVFFLFFLTQNRQFLGITHLNPTTKRLPLSLILLIVTNIISSVYFALVPLQSIWMLSQISMGVIVFYFVQRVENKYVLFLIASRTIFKVSFFYIAYSALFFSNIINDPLDMYSQSDRFHALSFESNILASQALFWIFVEIKYRSTTKPLQNRLILSLVVIIFLSQTRAAIFCLVILALASIWKRSLTAPIGLIQLILISSIALFLGTVNIHQVAQNYTEDSLQGRVLRLVDLNTGTALYRKQVTDIALEDISNSRLQIQLIGSGTNSFKQHHEIDISKVESGYISSLWIQIFYDAGLMGLILIVLFFFNQFRMNTAKSFIGKIFYVSVFLSAGVTNMIWFAYLWLSLAFFVESQTIRPSKAKF